MLQPDSAIMEKQNIASMSETCKKSRGADGDRLFRWLTALFAGAILLILAVMIFEMTKESLPAIVKFNWKFLTVNNWDVVQEDYGSLAFLYGSVVSSILAILLATPLSVATALFITEAVDDTRYGGQQFDQGRCHAADSARGDLGYEEGGGNA